MTFYPTVQQKYLLHRPNSTSLSSEARPNITGVNNTICGVGAGTSLTDGTGNLFLGFNAGYNETGSNKLYIDNSNTAIFLIYGDFNTNALTINGSLTVTGAYKGLLANQSGAVTNRTSDDLSATMTGILNTVYGRLAGAGIIAGTSNAIFGSSAGTAITSGNNTTLMGYSAGKSLTDENWNTMFGYDAGENATGDRNIFLGSYAGRYLTGGGKLAINSYNQVDAAHDLSDSLIYGELSATVSSQKLQFNCGYMGFFSTTATGKPTVSGARDETEGAIASLCTALANLGLITDSTTAS